MAMRNEGVMEIVLGDVYRILYILFIGSYGKSTPS
jgi:hypothetical protein